MPDPPENQGIHVRPGIRGDMDCWAVSTPSKVYLETAGHKKERMRNTRITAAPIRAPLLDLNRTHTSCMNVLEGATSS